MLTARKEKSSTLANALKDSFREIVIGFDVEEAEA